MISGITTLFCHLSVATIVFAGQVQVFLWGHIILQQRCNWLMFKQHLDVLVVLKLEHEVNLGMCEIARRWLSELTVIYLLLCYTRDMAACAA